MKHILSVMTSYIWSGKSPIKWRERPDMNIVVGWDVKHHESIQYKQTKQNTCVHTIRSAEDEITICLINQATSRENRSFAYILMTSTYEHIIYTYTWVKGLDEG